MLTTVTCAVMCGARGYSAIAPWIHAQPREVWWLLGFYFIPPTENAFRELLKRLDPELLEEALRSWIADQIPTASRVSKPTRPSCWPSGGATGASRPPHWVRGTLRQEDRCRIRHLTAGHNLACFRNAVVNLLRLAKIPNLAAAVRQNAYRTDLVLP